MKHWILISGCAPTADLLQEGMSGSHVRVQELFLKRCLSNQITKVARMKARHIAFADIPHE